MAKTKHVELTKDQISSEISDLLVTIKKYTAGEILDAGALRYIDAIKRLKYLRVMQTRFKR